MQMRTGHLEAAMALRAAGQSFPSSQVGGPFALLAAPGALSCRTQSRAQTPEGGERIASR
jgi:hypothetical protein